LTAPAFAVSFASAEVACRRPSADHPELGPPRPDPKGIHARGRFP
jgi:hypothetical protein